MEVVEKVLHQLKNGNTFAVIKVKGKRGEQFSLTDQGLLGQAIFFHEAPKSNVDCAYLSDKNVLELGGAEQERERNIYLIMEPVGATRDANKAYSEERL